MPDVDRLVAIVKSAKRETLEGKNCFVVPLSVLSEAVDVLGGELEGDARLAAAGYDNFRIVLTVADKRVYYLVSKTGPILDELWEKK
jgi:hypothetical protein